MEKIIPVTFENVDIIDGFWSTRQKINREVTIFSVRDRFIDTGRFEAFKFNWTQDSALQKPHFFWDSDVAKWMESVAYIILKNPNAELLQNVEDLIDLIEKNQCEDGYFNIYHTIVEPEKRFKKRDNHELYCLGHLIEAAVAYYIATGKIRFVDILDKYIDYVIKVFCEEKTAAFVTPGHEEIELALIKLYRLKKDKKYLDLALFFLNNRGEKEEILTDWCKTSYSQSHKPVRKQNEAMGHCVRACYLYSAMADAAKETGDEQLFNACKSLFDDIVTKKMYISGGIGSSHHGEAFTVAYDLPNDTAYSETCAAISLSMFADRMKDIDFDSKYADIVEREMYNGMLSGVSLDGKAFFYENPLEINIMDSDRHTSMMRADGHLPITQRKEVFDCSCCPPNVTRYIASIGSSLYSEAEDKLFVHQFVSSSARINGVTIKTETKYPSEGKIKFSVNGANGKSFFVRIPGWCKNYVSDKKYETVNGYAKYDITEDDFELLVDLQMSPVFYMSASLVRHNSRKIAVMMGPVLYCVEAVDNKTNLSDIRLDVNNDVKCSYDEFFCANVLTTKGYVSKTPAKLYFSEEDFSEEEIDIKLIPYFAFANRGSCDMRVWLNK